MPQVSQIYKGWSIVAASFFTYMVVWGGCWYSFSVFSNIFVRDFNWERGPTTGVFSLSAGTVFLTAPLAGKLIDLYGPRLLMPFGALLLGISLLICTRINSLFEFYLYYGVGCGLGMSLLLFTSQAAVVSRWFQVYRGTAIGLSLSGSGIGMIALVPLVQWITARFGWQAGFTFLGIVVISIIFPVIAFLMRFPREEETRIEQGIPLPAFLKMTTANDYQVVAVDPVWTSTIWTIEKAIRTSRFWFVCIAGVIGNVSVVQTIFAHFILMGTQAGYPASTASKMLGLAGIMGTAGFLFWGKVSDRLGREHAYTLGSACLLLSLIFLIFLRSSEGMHLFFLFSIFFGFGYGSRAPLAMSICADLFQGTHFASIYGTYQMTLLLGMLSPWIAGIIVDRLESYDVIIVGMMGSVILSSIFIWLAGPRRIRRLQRPGDRGKKNTSSV
jgi:MFS family permease